MLTPVNFRGATPVNYRFFVAFLAECELEDPPAYFPGWAVRLYRATGFIAHLECHLRGLMRMMVGPAEIVHYAVELQAAINWIATGDDKDFWNDLCWRWAYVRPGRLAHYRGSSAATPLEAAAESSRLLLGHLVTELSDGPLNANEWHLFNSNEFRPFGDWRADLVALLDASRTDQRELSHCLRLMEEHNLSWGKEPNHLNWPRELLAATRPDIATMVNLWPPSPPAQAPVSQAEGSKQAHPDSKAASPDTAPVIDREMLAIAAILTIGPNVKAIAHEIGVPRSTLYGWPNFKAALAKATGGKPNRKGKRSGERDFESVE